MNNVEGGGASTSSSGRETCYQECSSPYGDKECNNYCVQQRLGEGRCRLISSPDTRCCCLPPIWFLQFIYSWRQRMRQFLKLCYHSYALIYLTCYFYGVFFLDRSSFLNYDNCYCLLTPWFSYVLGDVICVNTYFETTTCHVSCMLVYSLLNIL